MKSTCLYKEKPSILKLAVAHGVNAPTASRNFQKKWGRTTFRESQLKEGCQALWWCKHLSE
jgi:hypothetical protein